MTTDTDWPLNMVGRLYHAGSGRRARCSGKGRLTSVKVRQNARSVRVESESQRLQSAAPHRLDDAPLFCGPRVEHEESSAAGAHQLAANGSGTARRFVVLVDGRVAHVGRKLALVGPMFVKELSVEVDLATKEKTACVVTELLDAVHSL